MLIKIYLNVKEKILNKDTLKVFVLFTHTDKSLRFS